MKKRNVLVGILVMSAVLFSMGGVSAAPIVYPIGYVWNDTGLELSGSYARIKALAVNDSKLYAGGATEVSGSYESRVFRYDGGTTWTSVGDLGGSGGGVSSLISFDGNLYGGRSYGSDDRVFRYDGGTTWTPISSALDNGYGVMCLGIYDNKLHAGTDGWARVWRYDGGTTWTKIREGGSSSSVNSLADHSGTLYASTYEGYDPGNVYSYDGSPLSWTDVGSLGWCRFSDALISYDGELYAGGRLNDSGIFRYDGGTTWTWIQSGGIYSSTIFGNELFWGAGSSIISYNGSSNIWYDEGSIGSGDCAYDLIEYNSDIYAAGGNHGKVYRRDILYETWTPSWGIYGWSYELPSYRLSNHTDIVCSNSSYNSSLTTNDTGYYLFDNLQAGNYWINATKYGYKNNNAIVEVMSGYNETLVDNCDAISNNGNWVSDAPISADTYTKGEGDASIKVVSNQTEGWVSNASIISGDLNGFPMSWAAPSEFYGLYTGKYGLIVGHYDGGFYGFNWTGNNWENSTSITNGLGDKETATAPTVFYKDSTWYLIYGRLNGAFEGYNWTGSTWQTDEVIKAGLGDIGDRSKPTVFEMDSNWYLIAGNNTGLFTGFKWNSTSSQWDSNNEIITGLADVGTDSAPSVLNVSGTFKMLCGELSGVFNGYYWNGTSWITDSSIEEGLSDIGAKSTPNFFKRDTTYYLISGRQSGALLGYKFLGYQPECFFQKDFTIPVSVTNVSKSAGYLALWYYIYNASNISTNVKVTIYSEIPINGNYMYWEISKTYFENGWNEVYLPLSEGTESGTLNLGAISKFKLEIPGTEDPYMVHRIDYIRFVEYPYTLHNIYLEPEDEGGDGVGTYYPPPHLVELRVQNIWGKTYPNALVTAQGYSTTMGTWDWLYSIFGFKNETQIHNVTMSDTTDDDGQLTFLMVETIKYRIDVSDTESPARFENKTFWRAPKDERYNLVVSEGWKWQKAGTEEQKEMSINVTASTNETHAFINVSYNDPSNKTTYLAFYLNHTVDNNVEECLQSANWSNTSVKNHSFVLSEYEGRAYKIQVVTEHEEWGSRTWTYAKRFEGMLIDLNLPDSVYPMIAVAILLFTGGIWGRSSATQGALIMCFEGWVFYAIGFLSMIPTATILSALALASVVSIIAIMMEKSRKTGVQ